MKIYGDTSEFTNYKSEPACIGYNDVLQGNKRDIIHIRFSFIDGDIARYETIQPTLYLHFSNSLWSTFTGLIREYCLPWRWKAAYLEEGEDKPPRRILICTDVKDGNFPKELEQLAGKCWFATNLINRGLYRELFDREYLQFQNARESYTFHYRNPIFPVQRYTMYGCKDQLCHIYRQRSLFSTFKYHVLKQFSSEWKEITLPIGKLSEKILVKKADEQYILEKFSS